MKNREVVYKGNTYKSVVEFARAFKISAPNFFNYIRSGWTVYMAVTYQSENTFVNYFKHTHYNGVEDFVKQNKLNFHIFMTYFMKTNDINESLRLTRNHMETKGTALINFRGSMFKKVKTVCDVYGINECDVINRVLRGELLNDVLENMIDREIVIDYKENKSFVVDGKNFECLYHVSEHYRINFDALQSRLYQGDLLETAVKYLKRDVNKYCYKNKYFKSIREVSEFSGAKESGVRNWFNLLGDIERAVEYSLLGKKVTQKEKIKMTNENVFVNKYTKVLKDASKKTSKYRMVNRYGKTYSGSSDCVIKYVADYFEVAV